MLRKKIFIQIASYRDPELINTIESCLRNAKNPENLVFGICNQFHPEDSFGDLSEYRKDNRFRIVDYDLSKKDGLGACWARHQLQQLYEGEDYTLQIDSHMRFNKNWDEVSIDMISNLIDKGYKKPLLTSYVTSFNPKTFPEEISYVPWRMTFDRFTPEGVVFFLPEHMNNYETLTSPIKGCFYSAHFCFTLGIFSEEVQHDPDFYFHGEEISIAVRAYTHGYDIFHPHRVVAWHEYTREGRTKHWDDDKDWVNKNTRCHKLNRQLLGVDGEYGYVGNYGLGEQRTIEEYENYSGIRFKDRSVRRSVLDRLDPPSIDSQEYLKIFKHCIDIKYSDIPKDEYNFWAVILKDKEDKEIYRKDLSGSELSRLLQQKDGYYKVWVEAHVDYNEIGKWVVWPNSVKDGWVHYKEGIV